MKFKILDSNITLSEFLHRILIWLIVIAITIVAITMAGWMLVTRSEARLALSEAKNVELAITLLQKESYGYGGSVYDATKSGGVSTRYLEDLKTFADVEGNLQITGWNETKDELESFVYQTGSFIVYYEKDEATDQEDWSVTYSLPILNY